MTYVPDPAEWLSPDWRGGSNTHNWRNYIRPCVREIWHTFTDEQKRRLMEAAEEQAGDEVWE